MPNIQLTEERKEDLLAILEAPGKVWTFDQARKRKTLIQKIEDSDPDGKVELTDAEIRIVQEKLIFGKTSPDVSEAELERFVDLGETLSMAKDGLGDKGLKDV